MKIPWLAVFLTALIAVVVLAAVPLNITMSANKITRSGDVVRFDLRNPGQEAAITHIFNLQGEQVAELSAQSLGRFSWDGSDTDRQPVESGLYVVQIRHHGEVWHGPILVNR